MAAAAVASRARRQWPRGSGRAALAAVASWTRGSCDRLFGDSEAPSSTASYSILHIVGDIVALIDALSKDQVISLENLSDSRCSRLAFGCAQVFVVGHDWGAMVAWWLCVLRPDVKVKALVNLSVAYSPRNPKLNPVGGIRAIFGDDHYICRFQFQLVELQRKVRSDVAREFQLQTQAVLVIY